MKRYDTKQLVLSALFGAIVVVLAFTPIGFIQLGVSKATIIHVPVIIGSILLGPKMGAGLGALFGATSLVSNTAAPVLSSFVFSPFIPVPGTASGSPLALVICFVPRILVGVLPWYVFRFLARYRFNKSRCLVLAGVAGSAVNTLLVMHLIYFLFKDAYAGVKGISPDAVYGVIATVIFANGIPEAVVAGALVLVVCKGVLRHPAIQKSVSL